MELQVIFVLCAVLLTAAAQAEEKTFRKDYVYDRRTDAFYKIHEDSGSASRQQVCELEGATLVPPMSEQELAQAHVRMNQQQLYAEDGDAAARVPVVDYSGAQDVLKMSCQVTTWDGFVTTSSVFRNTKFFICKIEAKDVPYDSQCRVHVRGYQYFPSVGSCYKIPRVAYTWHQAAAECQAEGAHLAVINSEQEALVLKNLAVSVGDITGSRYAGWLHIGFRAVENTKLRVFKTIYGETLEAAGYSTWVKNEPSITYGGRKENCGAIFRDDGKLNDIQCLAPYGFICEKELTCRGH